MAHLDKFAGHKECCDSSELYIFSRSRSWSSQIEKIKQSQNDEVDILLFHATNVSAV